MSISTKPGAPLPYRMEVRGQPPVPHAVITCCDCSEQDCFVFREKANPTFIAQKFERRGWEVNRQTARCPAHAKTNAQRRAHFAKKDEQMQNVPHIGLVKNEKHHSGANKRANQVFLVIVDGETGVPSIQALEGAQEMLFGEKTYLVIPQSDG